MIIRAFETSRPHAKPARVQHNRPARSNLPLACTALPITWASLRGTTSCRSVAEPAALLPLSSQPRHNVQGAVARMAACTAVMAVLACCFPAPASATIGEALSKTLTQVAPDWVVVICLAALPLIELRGAIPVGIVVFHMHPALVLFLSFIGNMLPVPLLLLGLGPLTSSFSRFPALQRVLDQALERARNQAAEWGSQNVVRALALFVGVPLPGTGAWSGAVIAFVLGLPLWEGMLGNAVGVLLAGTLVTVLSCMGWPGFWTAFIFLLTLPVVSFAWSSMSMDTKG